MSSQHKVLDNTSRLDGGKHPPTPSILSILKDSQSVERSYDVDLKNPLASEIKEMKLPNSLINTDGSVDWRENQQLSQDGCIQWVSASQAACIPIEVTNQSDTLAESKLDADNTYFEYDNNEVVNETEENNDKNTDPEDIEELDEEEEDKNENFVEAQDFNYFKQQWRFERFVTQLGNDNRGPDALRSFFGGYASDKQQQISDDEISKEVVGFDTRF